MEVNLSLRFSMLRFMVLRPNITIFFTLLAVGVSFAWLGVDEPSKWHAGIALYILGRTCSSMSILG